MELLACGEKSSYIIIALNVILIGALIYYILANSKSLKNNNVLFPITMIIGGGLSNLIDRLFRGAVVDYIDINSIFKYPIFNLADIFITSGVVIIICCLIIKIFNRQEKT